MGEGITQNELDRLFTAALETAIALLEKQGDFFPVVFEMRRDRTIHTVAVLDRTNRSTTQDLMDGFHQALRPRAADGTIVASAIASDRKGWTGEEAICVALRAANYASDVHVAYRIDTSGILRKTREVELAGTRAVLAVNEVFGQ